jgi:DNA modification methylase
MIQCNVKRLPLPDDSIDMIFSDPPYVKDFIHTYAWLAAEAARVLKPGRFVAVMCGGNYLNQIMRWFDDTGLDYYWLYQFKLNGNRTGIVWKYGNTQVPITIRAKNVIVYSKGKGLPRTATIDLYDSAARADKHWHYWGQSVDSHRYYIDCFSAEGDLVLDPMCGGGTTAAACELLNRRCIVGDLDPEALRASVVRLSGSFDALPLFAGLEG